jgi:hypothetical protein
VSGNQAAGILFLSSSNNIIGKNKNGIVNKITTIFSNASVEYNSSNNNIIQDISVFSCYTGFLNSLRFLYIENAIIKNCYQGIYSGTSGSFIFANKIIVEYFTNSALNISQSSANIKSLTFNYSKSTTAYGIQLANSNVSIDNLIANGNMGLLIYNTGNNTININSGTLGNIAPNSYLIYWDANNIGINNFSNVTGMYIFANPTNYPYLFTLTNCSDTDSNILNYSTNFKDYKISKDRSIYHGTTETSWKIEQLSSNINQLNKISFSTAKIAVNANKLTTISLWFKNSSSTLPVSESPFVLGT